MMLSQFFKCHPSLVLTNCRCGATVVSIQVKRSHYLAEQISPERKIDVSAWVGSHRPELIASLQKAGWERSLDAMVSRNLFPLTCTNPKCGKTFFADRTRVRRLIKAGQTKHYCGRRCVVVERPRGWNIEALAKAREVRSAKSRTTQKAYRVQGVPAPRTKEEIEAFAMQLRKTL
jgi:hypothetical protein